VPDCAAAVAFGTFLRSVAGEFLFGIEFFCDFALSLDLQDFPDPRIPLDMRGFSLVSRSARRNSHHRAGMDRARHQCLGHFRCATCAFLGLREERAAGG
jgi:hypothetical protein